MDLDAGWRLGIRVDAELVVEGRVPLHGLRRCDLDQVRWQRLQLRVIDRCRQSNSGSTTGGEPDRSCGGSNRSRSLSPISVYCQPRFSRHSVHHLLHSVDRHTDPRFLMTFAMSALGQKRTYAVQQPMSALLSIATAKADFPQKAMSALPPKADMCGAIAHVRFVPKADIHECDWIARS